MAGSIFSMPSRDEKIQHGGGHCICSLASRVFPSQYLLEKVGSLLYTRKTYLLKYSSDLKVAPCNVSNFRRTDPFTSYPVLSTPTSKCSHLILKLELVHLLSQATLKAKSGSLVISLAAVHPMTKRAQWARGRDPQNPPNPWKPA